MEIPILLPNIFNHPFTYKTNIKLKIGDFVEVPFGKKNIIGVVWDEFEEKSQKTFKIKSVIRKVNIPSLEIETIKFLDWFSQYNLIPKGMALKLVLMSGHAIEKLPEKEYENFNSF